MSTEVETEIADEWDDMTFVLVEMQDQTWVWWYPHQRKISRIFSSEDAAVSAWSSGKLRMQDIVLH